MFTNILTMGLAIYVITVYVFDEMLSKITGRHINCFDDGVKELIRIAVELGIKDEGDDEE